MMTHTVFRVSRSVRRLAALLAVGLLAACATITPPVPQTPAEIDAELQFAQATSVFGPAEHFHASSLEEVGKAELYPAREPDECEVAMLESGEGSFAARMEMLRNARRSIRIQALVFKGDEAGLRIAEVLKQKKAEGLDVRVIVDAFSNPWLQTQWMFFDLKQHGIEVEGYEAMALQWLNEVPLPALTPHFDPAQPDKRFHEKMWIIDGETEDAVAVTGGLNVGNEYFRVDPSEPDFYWRDQDVVLRGKVVGDLVTAFERNFEYFVGIKKAKGLLNTNLYWDATRAVLDSTGKLPVHYSTEPHRVARVAELEARQPALDYQPAACRFFQSRPRLKETYIQQAYLKLIERARREVLIANAYFVPTPSMIEALGHAARRCVSVRIISNSPETNDLPEISMVGRGYYKRLLAINDAPEVAACDGPEAGVRIWEWVGQAPDEAERSQGTMHSKFAVIDAERSLVGSYNLDPRSEKLNSETAVVFESDILSAELAKIFYENDLAFSRQVTPERADEFQEPTDALYKLRKEFGGLFESQL